MPEDSCIIKEGEAVYASDPRLLDTNCTLEAGVVIRPDEPAVKDTGKAKTAKALPRPKPQPPAPVVVLPAAEPPALVVSPAAPVIETKETLEVVVAPRFSETVENDIPIATVITVAAVGVAGVAATAAIGAMTNTTAAIATLKLKITSLLGNKVAIAAGAGVVTAGTIVAVKTLESKFKSYEKEMKESRLEVEGISTAVDKIDLLLSKLENDELDPTVE